MRRLRALAARLDARFFASPWPLRLAIPAAATALWLTARLLNPWWVALWQCPIESIP